MGLLKPDYIFKNISYLTIELLEDLGIKGIILDADNTILAYKSISIEKPFLKWIDDIKNKNIKIVIVSNNFSKRISKIAQQTDVPYISMALKPLPFKLFRAIKIMGLKKNQVLVVGDQLFTDVLGARLAGLKVTLVSPLSQNDSIITRILRNIEKQILNRQNKKEENK